MYTISAGGCYTSHPAPFTMERPNGIPEYLLLFIHTKALFHVGTKTFEVEPNQMLIIDRDVPYWYSSLEATYTDDWMHFNCQGTADASFLPNVLNTPITLGNASRVSFYVQQVLWEYAYAQEANKKKHVHMLMCILMNHIKEAVSYQDQGHTYSPYYEKMQEIRLQIQSNPGVDTDLDSLCQTLSISSSYFQHLYTKLFGISFRNDIIDMRIHYAKELLAGTTDTIENVALLCGYHNEVHFYRQFRSLVGMTPTAYRKNMQTPPVI